jgi:bifunctional UDP-N-acetylglucosamine pyrophosphorylase/glucosamine-1-phosphate N-acetyltransferase
MSKNLTVVILAAGKGTRIRSKLLKVLHPLAGSTVIEHVLTTAKKLLPKSIYIVHGHQSETLKNHLKDDGYKWVHQLNPQGTGHAVQLALPNIDPESKVLVLVGDAPLIDEKDLSKLLKYEQAVLTAQMQNPFGYGRIIKNQDDQVTQIVEQKDANLLQQSITEINSGILLAKAQDLIVWLNKIDKNNAQGELYLTDVLALAHQDGKSFHAIKVNDSQSIQGINDRIQLAQCEAVIQTRIKNKLMSSGVYMPYPDSVQIRGNVECGEDILLDCGVILEGENILADDVSIGAYSIIKNCNLGKNTRIQPHSMLENVTTQGDCDIGPFARLRPGTTLATKAKVGNFVETKKATIGHNSKASHLTYLGDCDIGNNVNIGAGTITCNYDGVNKFKTIIEDDVFIGSDSQLIAPVTVGKGATIGAGTTLTKNAEAQKLTISRAKQRTISHWQKPTKQ